MELAAASPKYLIGNSLTYSIQNKYYAKSSVNSNHDNLAETNEEKWHLSYFFYDTAHYDQCITCGIHGFDFAVVPLSFPEQYRRVVLLPSHTHQISRWVVRL